MDILSYQQAMKAKKAIKKLNDRIGVGESASGDPADYVDGVDKTVKERLETLEAKDPKITLYNRVSELEAHTAINLNKHNLFLKSVLDKSRFNLINLVYEDFSDDSRIDKDKSQNYTFDPVRQKVTPSDPQTPAEIVMVATSTDTPPTMFTISQYSNDLTQDIKTFDLENGVHTNTETINNQIQLVSQDGGLTFSSFGIYESPVLDLGDNFKNIVKINYVIDIPADIIDQIQADYQIYTSTSTDNLTFSDWQPLNPDGTIISPSARYIKIKAEIKAGGENRDKFIYDFTTIDESSNFEQNDYASYSGCLKLKTEFQSQMITDSSFTDSGTLLSFTIDKSKFKSIEKIEVI